MTKLTLIAAQRPHLQTPSHQILRLCHMNFEETQNFIPYLAKTVGIYLSHLHLPVHWDLGDSGSTSWASLPDKGWIRFCAIRLSSSLNHLLAKTCSSHEESQELSFTFPWITHAKNHWSKQIKLSKLKVKSKKYTPSTVEVMGRGESEGILKYRLIFETFLLQEAFSDCSNSSSQQSKNLCTIFFLVWFCLKIFTCV